MMIRKATLFALAVLASAARAETLPDIAPVAPTTLSSALPSGWNKSASFMEIFVRSYSDSDGDGVGDIKGLTSKLDYLKDLGVTGLWLMPMGPSEDRDHGYAQRDYRAINPEYGTLADFDELVREAHKRGIGIIIDWVVNHSASTDPLFLDAAASEKSRFRSWYNFSKDDPKWKVDGHFPWHKNKLGEGYFYAAFSDHMPDWNLKNPEVVDYLFGSMRFWLNKGVDGFRVDAVTMLFEDGPTSTYNNPKNPPFTAQMAHVVNSYDNRFMVCEADKGADMYAQTCGSAFAFGAQQEIRKSVLEGKASPALIAQLKNPARAHMPLTLQTHDSYVGDRLINQYGVNGLDNYIAAVSIALLGSDVSFSYYGEEIGESNNSKGDDPGLRAPMSWTPDSKTAGFTSGKPYRDVAINVASNNVEAQLKDPASLYHVYQALYRVRRDYPLISSGKLELISKEGDSVLLFKRTDGADTAFIVINLADKPIALKDLPIDASYSDILHLPGVELSSGLIPAKRAIVLKAR
jgi:maltose alpha-D-glucosyltransferase/alpha-amylase